MPKNQNSFFNDLFSYFLIDRVWGKGYHYYFSSYIYKNDIRKMYESGELKEVTNRAFRAIRSLECVVYGLRRFYSCVDTCVKEKSEEQCYAECENKLGYGLIGIDVSKCSEIRKMGKQEYMDFDLSSGELVLSDGVLRYRIGLNELNFIVESFKMFYFYERNMVSEYYYFRVSPWLAIAIYPYAAAFRPHMIRFFLNCIVYAREKCGINSNLYESYEYVHDNFIPVEALSDKVIEMSHKCLDNVSSEILSTVTKYAWLFFGNDFASNFVYKITQVELVYDGCFDKVRMLTALKLFPYRLRVVRVDNVIDKNDVEDKLLDIEGFKALVNLRKDLGFKVYTKAIRKIDYLLHNRFEIRLNVKLSVDLAKWDRLFDKEVLEYISRLKALYETAEKYKQVVKFIDKVLKNIFGGRAKLSDATKALFFDIALAGAVRRSKVMDSIAKPLLEKGVIKIERTGRMSWYVLNDSYINLSKELRHLLGIELVFLKGKARTKKQE